MASTDFFYLFVGFSKAAFLEAIEMRFFLQTDPSTPPLAEILFADTGSEVQDVPVFRKPPQQLWTTAGLWGLGVALVS